jgi:transposase
MKYYAGLDVAMKETFICILDEEGQKIFESKCATEPHLIYEELAKGSVELEKIGLETGSLSHYLFKGLQDLGCKVICIDARKMAAILSVTINKTDKNDAKGIADAMRTNHYKPVHLRNIHDHSTTILLKSRAMLIQNRTALKNTVRGYLKAYGIRLGDVSHKKFPALVRERYADVLPEASKGIEGLLKSFEAINKEILTLENELKEICKQDQDVQLFMTAPGVGMIVALSYKTDLGDPARFKKSASVGAYYGMTPRQYSSGEKVKQGRISRCGAREIRTLLAEAAVVLLTRTQSWSPLKAWGHKLMKKYGASYAADRRIF